MKPIQFCRWLLCLLLLLTSKGDAKVMDGDTSITLKVSGNCGMCKKRIEKQARLIGATSAVWTAATQQLTIQYNSNTLTASTLAQQLANIGHDAGAYTATDLAYQQLPDCCHYRSATHAVHANEQERMLPPAAKKLYGLVMTEDAKGNFNPLKGANVRWLNSSIGTQTNATGYFELPADSVWQQLVVSFVGYRTDTMVVINYDTLKIILALNGRLRDVTVKQVLHSSFVSMYSPIRTQTMTEKELFKAACCNLSESFETNPSVDVSYADAVTGAKQIQLLGLSGHYTQLTVENLPGPRGLATPWGLNGISGAWIDAIQLTKGVGSVVNGFESMAGQINVEQKKPEGKERAFANVYVNDFGKTDLNANLFYQLNKQWSGGLLTHYDFLNNAAIDFNKDGFRDIPTGNQISVLNRYRYQNKGWIWQGGIKLLKDDKTGGETAFNPSTEKLTTNHYGLGITTERYEAFSKLGYVFTQKKYKSIGWQTAFSSHRQSAYFGQNSYVGHQTSWYSNLLYQSIIGNTNHKFRTGISVQSDVYNETWKQQPFARTETVTGAFYEYTYTPNTKWTWVGGLRADYHGLFGFFVTPRLHVKYMPANNTTFRFSWGRGQRTANIFAENTGIWVSSRQLQLPVTNDVHTVYGLKPEVSWNGGIAFDWRWKWFGRDASVGVDYFRTEFTNQVVVNLETPGQVIIGNLAGKSYSNSVQAEINVQPSSVLDVRLACRWLDVRTTYNHQLLTRPFIARNRAFMNVAYHRKWLKADYTITWNGAKRLPSTSANPTDKQMPATSPDFWLMNGQISADIGKRKPFTVYIGAENMTNFFQQTAIVDAASPFGKYFDASMVWGPVTGRMLYAGIRMKW